MKKGQKSIRGGIEDILIPMEYFRCTSGDFENNHPWYACDMAGQDGGQEPAYFPFSAKCVAVNPSDGNAVWWQSQKKVRFADGTIDYCTIMVLHDNDLNGIYVGAKYSQGEQMAVEGNKMGTTYGEIGNHLHFEFAKGKYTKQYDKNEKGYYLPNGIAIEKCCFADGTTFLTSSNWGWKYLKDVPVEEPKTEPKTEAPTTPPVDEDKVKITELQKRVDELEYQIDNLNAIQDVLEEENSKLKEQLANQPELIFKAPKTDYYAIRLEENQQLYLK